MPRQNYMSIPVPDSIQIMFSEFVKTKEITKTAALSDMVELYMLATDEKLYLDLKKKYLNVQQVKEMITDKNAIHDSNEQLLDTFIFMKLGNSTGNNGVTYDGIETIEIYKKDANERDYTWFSTESLYYGMSKSKLEYFKNKISIGETVKILFAVGANAGGNNDICYSAEVLDIKSDSSPIDAPEEAYPSVWSNSKARIWIKIKNIEPETTLTADKLVVKSTGALLKTIISNSQYHFGYVKLR